MLKNLQTALFAAILVVATTACSLFEKDIEVPQEFSFVLDQTESDAAQFSLEQDKDTRDDDVEKHKDDIKNSKIDKVTFTVSDFDGQGSPSLTANVKFAAKGATSFKTLGAINNADLKALSTSGEEVTVNITDEATKNELKDMILAGNIITFKLEGTTSATPVYAALNFKIYSNITVGF